MKNEKTLSLNFYELVYETVRMVPKGKVTTYSSIAKYLGSPRGSRAVGWAMRVCPYADVPCHRVVRSDGIVSGGFEDAERRVKKLKREKVKTDGRLVELAKYYFGDFDRQAKRLEKSSTTPWNPKDLACRIR